MEQKNKAAGVGCGDNPWQATLGTKMHKAFMAEIGEEMCQAEVAHHANKCPEYFCCRPVKYVHIYKKALAITRNKELDQENEEDMPWSSHDEGKDDAQGAAVMADAGSASRPKLKQKRVTNMSDAELYENRTQFVFEEDAGLSPHLPNSDKEGWTPEQQVMDASLFDFFRLVHFHGGRQPYLSWHEEDAFPIVVMSPVLKLADGPNFAIGARWALIQYYVWHDRREIMDASDNEVKLWFRQWMDEPTCPLVHLRGVRDREPSRQTHSPKQYGSHGACGGRGCS